MKRKPKPQKSGAKRKSTKPRKRGGYRFSVDAPQAQEVLDMLEAHEAAVEALGPMRRLVYAAPDTEQ